MGCPVRMKKAALALVAAAAVILGVYLSRPAPEVCYPDLGPAVTLPSVPDEPLEPTKPPTVSAVEWGPCENAGTLSSRQRSEDAWLREVLVTVKDGPLFGVPEWAMQAASCAAYRDRCRWMGCS